jgi:hypothetical protein
MEFENFMEVCGKRERKIYFILTIFLIFSLSGVFAWDSGDFVTTWKTDVAGTTAPTNVTLRFLKVATHTYEVSWKCDGNYELFYTSLAKHDYGENGTYDICIRSDKPLRFYMLQI